LIIEIRNKKESCGFLSFAASFSLHMQGREFSNPSPSLTHPLYPIFNGNSDIMHISSFGGLIGFYLCAQSRKSL